MSMDGEQLVGKSVPLGKSVANLGKQFLIAYRTGGFHLKVEGSAIKTDWSDVDGMFWDCTEGKCVPPTWDVAVFGLKTDRKMAVAMIVVAVLITIGVLIVAFVMLFWGTDFGLSLSSVMKPLEPVISMPFT
jgi:hypothetical protein